MGKEEAFLFILRPFCLWNQSDWVKANNYLIGMIYLQVSQSGVHLLVKWGQLENAR